MAKPVEAYKLAETERKRITLCGTTDIMFDRYAGDNKTKLDVHQKLYMQPGDSNIIGIPALNLMSFFSAHNTNSAPKRLREAKYFKKIANACLSFIQITPAFIPFMRCGNPIVFGKIENGVDKTSGIYVHHAVARLDKGIPNPKERPVLPLPWSLEFDLIYYPNKEIQLQEVLNLLTEGGRALGLGTFRGVFGKFIVEKIE